MQKLSNIALVKALEAIDEKLATMEAAERESQGCLHNDQDHGLCLDCGEELDPGYDFIMEGA